MSEMSNLLPCPFCGDGETLVDESKHWTGMRSVVISASVKHWCLRRAGELQSFLEIKGKTMEDAVARWNKRAHSAGRRER